MADLLIELQLTSNKTYVDWNLQQLINDQQSFRMLAYIGSGMWLI